nr:transposase domain-containing protein [Pseudoruegeria sp. HB172150]
MPDMPGSRQGVEKIVKTEGWRSQVTAARRRQGRGGGWEYHWQLFPRSAKRKLLATSAGAAAEQAERGEQWAYFDGLPEKAKATARARLGAIHMVEALEATGTGRAVAVGEVARVIGKTGRTLWAWLQAVEGVRSDDRLAALAPRHRPTAKVEPTEVRADPRFWDLLKADYLRLERPTFSACYRRACTVARERGWPVIPERTARRHLDQTVPRVVQVFARQGVSGLEECFPPQVRDRSTLAALEAVNADCHRGDLFVRWEDGTVARPQIVAFQDIYSGKILSWRVDHTPNKVAVMAAFGDMVEEFGIPRRCLFDNGREFANKWMTGGTPTRFRFKVREDDPLGVLPQLGIEVNWARPYSGRSKPIERAFRDWCDTIFKDPRFSGAWTGNRPDAKPENYASTAVPITEFLRVMELGVVEHNARTGRRSETAQGRSFDQTFAESYASAPIRKVTEEQRRLWLMGQETKTLHRTHGRLTLHQNVYWSDWMAEEAGRKVIARFDPEDLHAGIYVYALDGSYLGYAACQQKTGFTDAAAAQEEARQKAAFKRAHRRLLDLHRPDTAAEVAAALDALPTPETAPPDAKVVRPAFGANRPLVERPDFERRADPAAEQQHETFIAQFTSPARQNSSAEDEYDRFKRALQLEQLAEANQPLGKAEAEWLAVYRTQPEYRQMRLLYDDYGEAMFAN